MKKSLSIVLVLLCFAVFAQKKELSESVRREKKLALSLAKHPEVMAQFGTHKLTKKDVIKLVIAKHPDFEEYSFEELTDAVQQVMDEKIYFTILADFLKKEGFPPSQQRTLQYLRTAIKKFPPEMRKLKFRNSALQTLAADPERQLTVALQSYLKKKKPSEIAVSNEDVEFFYRVNQNIFTHDAQLNIAFIAVDKKQPDALKTINDAHSMIMQGVNFGKIAERINQKLPKELFDVNKFPAEIAAHASKMPLNEPSEVLNFPNYYAIIQVTGKQQPKYIPLKDAEFFIRTELESRKSGRYLEKLLYQLLEKTPVKRY